MCRRHANHETGFSLPLSASARTARLPAVPEASPYTGPSCLRRGHHVRATQRRHRLHPGARSCRQVAVRGRHLLPGPARLVDPALRACLLGARIQVAGALRLAHRPLRHRHRDPPRRHFRPARLHRPRHGRGDRRDGRDRRRLHHLPGRDAGRHLAGEGRQASSDARERRHRRRPRLRAGRLHGGCGRAGRLGRGGHQAGAGGRHGGRQPGPHHPGHSRRAARGGRGQDGFLRLRCHAGRRPGGAGDEGPDRQRLGPRAPDRAALAGDREALRPGPRAARRRMRAAGRAHHRELRSRLVK